MVETKHAFFYYVTRGKTAASSVSSLHRTGAPRWCGQEWETWEWGLPAPGGGWEGSHWGSLGLNAGLLHGLGSSLLTPGS